MAYYLLEKKNLTDIGVIGKKLDVLLSLHEEENSREVF